MICCNQIIKIFCTKYGSAMASSARRPCHFGPLADPAISFFREVSMNSVLCSTISTLLINSKDGSWKELACESLRSGTLSSTRFSLNSCSHSGMSEYNGSLLFFNRGLRFTWFFGFSVVLGHRVPPFYLQHTRHWHWTGIYPTQIFPFSSLTVA